MHVGAPAPFVVGSPRSGTTLLRLMLDAHPDLAIPPETGFLSAEPDPTVSDPRDAMVELVTTYPPGASAWNDYGLDRSAYREALERIDPFDVAEAVRAFYRLYAERHGKRRWGDKTPLYCRSVRRILDLLPEAHVVHLVRDGRDAAVSLRELWFSPGADMETQAAFWRANVEAAEQGRGHPRYLEVRYEALTRDPEGVLRRICAFLSLDFDVRMLRHQDRAAERLAEHRERVADDGSVVVTHAARLRQQARTTQPVDRRSVNRWRDVLSASEVGAFERVAGDVLRRYAYPTEDRR